MNLKHLTTNHADQILQQRLILHPKKKKVRFIHRNKIQSTKENWKSEKSKQIKK